MHGGARAAGGRVGSEVADDESLNVMDLLLSAVHVNIEHFVERICVRLEVAAAGPEGAAACVVGGAVGEDDLRAAAIDRRAKPPNCQECDEGYDEEQRRNHEDSAA